MTFDRNRVDEMLTRHGMHPQCIDLDAEIQTFLNHMYEGLQRPMDNSLLMLPTYLSADGAPPEGKSAIVIDAGGTNLRVALVRFENGEAITEYFKKYPMPGSEQPVNKQEMFDAIAACIAPLCERSEHIGFCFSYVFTSTPDRDGIVKAMCKEVEVEGIEQAHACAELEAALTRLGTPGTRRYVMLNDTVATLLGAKAVHGGRGYDSFAGLILGTGLNMCYVESTEKIGKLCAGEYDAAHMIVNMESGVYIGFEQGTVDRLLDSRSQFPGDHIFEKMVSGGYFGDLLHGVFALCCSEGFFSREFCGTIAETESVSLREITDYIEHKAESDNIYQVMAVASESDRATMNYVLDLLYERAARQVIVMLCAVAEQTDTGKDPARPLCVCAEGTTYYRSPLLLRHIDRLMEHYVSAERGRYIQMVKTESATLIGTALAAMLN